MKAHGVSNDAPLAEQGLQQLSRSRSWVKKHSSLQEKQTADADPENDSTLAQRQKDAESLSSKGQRQPAAAASGATLEIPSADHLSEQSKRRAAKRRRGLPDRRADGRFLPTTSTTPTSPSEEDLPQWMTPQKTAAAGDEDSASGSSALGSSDQAGMRGEEGEPDHGPSPSVRQADKLFSDNKSMTRLLQV